MKKFAFIALAAIMAVSCSDDDSSNSGLSGTWKLTSITTDQAVDANEDGTSSTDLIAETGCFDESNIIFKSGNNAELNINAYVGGTSCFEISSDATWTKDGNEVTFTFDNYDGTETEVFTKSGNTLTLDSPDFYEAEVTVGGNTQIVTVGAVLVYTKQ
ncbi:MAG: DUF5004 domain-containing protein [Flavobacterium sp.]|nr:MAG: DUF5004 domain-containing protein [Flavobacterium sp.]